MGNYSQEKLYYLCREGQYLTELSVKHLQGFWHKWRLMSQMGSDLYFWDVRQTIREWRDAVGKNMTLQLWHKIVEGYWFKPRWLSKNCLQLFLFLYYIQLPKSYISCYICTEEKAFFHFLLFPFKIKLKFTCSLETCMII